MLFRRILGSATAVAALTAAVFLYIAHPVRGSDHQDAPEVLSQPSADITDMYVFPGNDPKNIVFVMNVHPLLTHGNVNNYFFDPTVLYQFKIVNGPLGSVTAENTVIQALASGYGPNQSLTIYGPGAPNIKGTVNTLIAPIGKIPLNTTTNLGKITAWAGPRADPFFFDLFQFFKILPDRNYSNPRTGNQLGPNPSFNGYAPGSTSGPSGTGYACSTAPSVNALTQIGSPPGFNVLSLIIAVPRTMLAPSGSNPIIHVWGTTSVATGGGAGNYRQIEMHARPAEKELFETFNDHTITNHTDPYNDPTMSRDIQVFTNTVAGRSTAISNVIQAVLYPNEIAADLSQKGPAAYLGVETGGATGGKFGGRALKDNVIDISLGAVFGPTIPALHLAPDDGKENNCLTSQHVSLGQGGKQAQFLFPYLAPPH